MPTARTRSLGWSRPLMGNSTGRPMVAGQTYLARSSKSVPAVRWLYVQLLLRDQLHRRRASRAGLIQDSNGTLYGAAEGGGTNNRGTVFKITPAGRLTVIYNFCNLASCADGAEPYGGLVQAGNGSLFGATESGGQYGFGSIFSITPAGSFKTLYSFCASTGCPDGASPAGTLVQAANGVYYGTTQSGGVRARTAAHMPAELCSNSPGPARWPPYIVSA